MPAGSRVPLLALAALLAAGAAAAEAPRGPVFQALGPLATADGGAAFERAGVAVRVREVMGSERAAIVRQQTGSPFDPFDLTKDGNPLLRTFLIEIDNRSRSEAFFNPSFITLHLRHERLYPRGYTQLYRFLSAAIREDAQVVRFARLVEETSISIPPGTQAIKLLVFDEFPVKAKEAILDLFGIQAGADELGARISFARPKLEKKRGRR